MTPTIDLPPLGELTRGELEQLVGILHRALTLAHRDYKMLSETTQQAISTLQTLASVGT